MEDREVPLEAIQDGGAAIVDMLDGDLGRAEHLAELVLAAASVSWAEQLDTANAMEPHEKELRKLWREVAEKGIEQGVDWSRIVLTLFADLDAALARNAELEAKDSKWAEDFKKLAHECGGTELERQALRAELDSLRNRLTTLADELEQCARPCYCEHSKNARDQLAAIVRGTNDE